MSRRRPSGSSRQVHHELPEAAELDQFARQAERPIPARAQPRRKKVPENVAGRLDQPLGGGPVNRDLLELERREVREVLQRSDPAARASVLAADIDLVHAPVAAGVYPAHVEPGLDDPVVVHDLAPEHLFAQAMLPAAGQRVGALNPVGRDDLLPAVFRVAEDQRAGFPQIVVQRPELFLFLFDGARGELRDAPCQLAQDVALGAREGALLDVRVLDEG